MIKRFFEKIDRIIELLEGIWDLVNSIDDYNRERY